MKLRPYQQKSLDNILGNYSKGNLSQLLVLPTGAGKTVIFSNLIKTLKLKTLILSNTRSLKTQTKQVCDLICPGYSTQQTIQLIHRKGNLEKIKQENYECLIIDEAHHAASKSYEETIRYFKKNKKLILGCTATPFRLDRKSVYRIFPTVAYEATILKMIEDDYLSDIKGIRVKSDLCLDDVPTARGEFRLQQLSAVVNTENRNELIFSFYKNHINNKKTIIFCVDIKHCDTVTLLFNANGINCKSVHGKINKNKIPKILQEFKHGETNILTTCQLLTEGFDEPSIEAIIMARPTKSCGLYIQMIGRGLRKFNGKKECIVCEFTDNCHNICDFSTLITCSRSVDNSILGTKNRYSIRELSKEYKYSPQGNEIIIKEEDFLNKYTESNGMNEYQKHILKSLNIKYIEPLSYEIAELLINNHKKKSLYGKH